MKSVFLVVLVGWSFVCFHSPGFGKGLHSKGPNQNLPGAHVRTHGDSTNAQNVTVAKISQPKEQESLPGNSPSANISLIFTILLSLITLVFLAITFLAQRDRDKTKEELGKLEKRYEIIVRTQKDVLEQTDRYLDSALIMFNHLLPPDKRLAITLLKHVLRLRHYEENERFVAIKSLGELGDETVIPYLEWAAETDKKWAADAKIAIEDIKKRMAQEEGSGASS